MKFKTRILYSCALLSACFIIRPAFAQEAQPETLNACNNAFASCPEKRTYDIYQDLSGSVSANVDVNAGIVNDNSGGNPEISAEIISSSSSAIGNNISAAAQSGIPLNVATGQVFSSSVSAGNNVTTDAPLPGLLNVITTAHGNTMQAENLNQGIDVISDQSITNTATINANSTTYTAPDLGTYIVNTNATGNIIGTRAYNGDVSFVSNQDSAGAINATSDTTACCNINGVNVTANANANAATSYSETASAYAFTTQNSTGSLSANAIHNNSNGTEMLVAASASANQSILYNKWGYTQLATMQYSGGDVNSSGEINADYFRHNAIAGSSAQGNSALMYSIGAEGSITAYQDTAAGSNINSQAIFNGYTMGGVGSLTSSSAGNVATGFACTVCGPPGIGLNGNISQNNGANNLAVVTNNLSGYGAVNSAGFAAGNIGNFVTKSRSN